MEFFVPYPGHTSSCEFLPRKYRVEFPPSPVRSFHLMNIERAPVPGPVVPARSASPRESAETRCDNSRPSHILGATNPSPALPPASDKAASLNKLAPHP